MFIVGFNTTILWHDKFAPNIVPWANGNAGVDLFFVISSFIMVVSSRRLIGQPGAWRRFLVLRLVRIVPLHLLATVAKLALIVAVPAMALHSRPTMWNAVASFLFLPSRNTMGAIRPIIDVGWTLSFEMLFYLAFASALFFLVEPLFVVGPAMAFLAVVSLIRREHIGNCADRWMPDCEHDRVASGLSLRRTADHQHPARADPTPRAAGRGRDAGGDLRLASAHPHPWHRPSSAQCGQAGDDSGP
jgi:hypothetical protein